MTRAPRPNRQSRSSPSAEVVTGVLPEATSERLIEREFRARLDAGARLLPVGDARVDVRVLDQARYRPRHKVRLFDATFYLTGYRFDAYINFLVGYVVLDAAPRRIHPRIFYKDSSLVWRVGSHLISNDDEHWIGKGDVREERRADGVYHVSCEESTNLPYEIQAALDVISRGCKPRRDAQAARLVLRRAPSGRVHPYADFARPRARAGAERPIYAGRPVARITRAGDPTSLRFAAGFAPDFSRGPIEVTRSRSQFYGGTVAKYRILSHNGVVQYQFVASPTHVFVNPPQSLSRDLTSFGVRSQHVWVDDEAFIPGYEFHYLEEATDPPHWVTQIPAGFAGAPHADDASRADVSAWNEALPVIREFRRCILGQG